LADFNAVEEKDLPTLRILDPSDHMKKFKWEGNLEDLTVNGIKTFIDDFNSKKLEPFLRS